MDVNPNALTMPTSPDQSGKPQLPLSSSTGQRKTVSISLGLGSKTQDNESKLPEASDLRDKFDTSVVHNIDDEGVFKQIIQQFPHVIVDFYANWCGPCKIVAPKYVQLAKEFNSSRAPSSHVLFLKVDADVLESLVQSLNVTQLPSFVIFKDGQPQTLVAGAKLDVVTQKLNAYFPGSTSNPEHAGTSTTTTISSQNTSTTSSSHNPESNTEQDCPSTPPSKPTSLPSVPPPSIHLRPQESTAPRTTSSGPNIQRIVTRDGEVLATGSGKMKLSPRPQELVKLLDSLSTYHILYFYSSGHPPTSRAIPSPSYSSGFGFGSPTNMSASPNHQELPTDGESQQYMTYYQSIIDSFKAFCLKKNQQNAQLKFTAIDIAKEPVLAKEYGVTPANMPVVKLLFKKVVYLTVECATGVDNVEPKINEFLAL